MPVIDRVIATITVLISSRNCNQYITSYLHAKVFIIVWKSSSVSSMNVHVHVWMLFQQASIPARRPGFQPCCSSNLSSWKFENQNVCMQEFPAWLKPPQLVPKSLAQQGTPQKHSLYLNMGSWLLCITQYYPIQDNYLTDFNFGYLWPVPHDNYCVCKTACLVYQNF